MLVLTRKVGESLLVIVDGQCIYVHVLERRGHRIRLGVDAPSEAMVWGIGPNERDEGVMGKDARGSGE